MKQLSMGSPRPCARCETLPARTEGAGTLYLWFPIEHSLGKFVGVLRAGGEEYRVLHEGGGVAVRLDTGASEGFIARVAGAFSGEELRDTRVLLMAGTDEPRLADYPRVITLRRFLAQLEANWLLDLIEDDRLTSHFQPIAHADDPAMIYAQEALLRGIGADGALVSPGRILGVARGAGLLFQLDLLGRRVAIREAGRHGLSGPIFINFNPTAIYDPTFCLRSTVAAVDAVGIPHEKIVFEVTESDRTQDLGHLRTILDFYRSAGFGIALDDIGSGYSSLNLIHQLRPDYIKLDMELIRGVHSDPYKALIAAKLLEIARELGIRTVAEGIERREELEWVRAHGATFVQGYLIARPTSPPLTALARPAQEAIAAG